MVNWKRTSGLWNWFLLSFLQISIPMSAEFEELMKARDNPSEEAQSECGSNNTCLFWVENKPCTTCKSHRTEARGTNASWLFNLLQQQKWDLMRKLIGSSYTALSNTLLISRSVLLDFFSAQVCLKSAVEIKTQQSTLEKLHWRRLEQLITDSTVSLLILIVVNLCRLVAILFVKAPSGF